MKKICLFALIVLAFTGCTSLSSDNSTISVSGSAEIVVPADVAIFSVSAESVENTSDEARAVTSEMINRAVDILVKDHSIDPTEIATSHISISPYFVWKENERVLSGQMGMQSITVTLSDISKYGAVFESLSKVDGLSVSSASFDKVDKNKEYDNVRALAVEDAFRKASSYAEAAGMKIESVLSISDGSVRSYTTAAPMMSMKAEGLSNSSTTVYATDITIQDSINVIYTIKKK